MGNMTKILNIIYAVLFVDIIYEMFFTVYYHMELWQYNLNPYEIKDYVSIILPIILIVVNIIYLIKNRKPSKGIIIFDSILILLIPFRFERFMLVFGALFGPFITID